MSLFQRATQVKDFEACFDIMQDNFLYDGDSARDLFEMWKDLLLRKSALSGVIEDVQESKAPRLVGFALGVFVDDDFVSALMSGGPYVSKLVLSRWQKGQSPILSETAIGLANSISGVNWLGLHMGIDPSLSEDDRVRVCKKSLEGLIEHVSGNNLKFFMKEVFGEKERDTFRNLCIGVLNSYKSYFGGEESDVLLSIKRPYLMGIEKAKVFKIHKDKIIHQLFDYTPPVYYFEPHPVGIPDRTRDCRCRCAHTSGGK